MLIDNVKNINIDNERWYVYTIPVTTFYVFFKNMSKNTHHIVCEKHNMNVKLYKGYVASHDLYRRVGVLCEIN